MPSLATGQSLKCKPGVIEETTGNENAAENKVECSLEQGLIVGISGWGCGH